MSNFSRKLNPLTMSNTQKVLIQHQKILREMAILSYEEKKYVYGVNWYVVKALSMDTIKSSFDNGNAAVDVYNQNLEYMFTRNVNASQIIEIARDGFYCLPHEKDTEENTDTIIVHVIML